MPPEFDLVVIGGGSGGLVVAAGGAALGAKVALVEKHKMGGDCLWYGCIPSKTLLKSAKVAMHVRSAAFWGVDSRPPEVSLARVMAHVSRVIEEIEPNDSPERFRQLGVDVTLGEGRFISRREFEVGGRVLCAKNFVIATGSRPTLPPIAGIKDIPTLTNETVFALRENVPSLIVIGAGPMGCELAQAFARLGSKVSVIDSAWQILSKEDSDAARIVQSRLEKEGVVFHLRSEILEAHGRAGDIQVSLKSGAGLPQTVLGTHLLVAAGRKPNLENLGLENAGVRTRDGHLIVDARLRTTNPRIYACGDAAGELQFTHLAAHQAGIILRQAIFKLFWAKPSTAIPWCTFTDPELARIGPSERDLLAAKVQHRVYRFPYADLDRARTEGETEGFIKVMLAPRGKILGATVVGANAGEIIHEYILAIHQGLTLGELSGIVHIYPTYAEINKRVSDQMQKEGFTPKAKCWVQRIFRLQGSRNPA